MTDDELFDPSRLRVSQDFASTVGTRRLLTTVLVQKPSKEWWVRTHPNRQDYWLETCVIELETERETYLVANPDLWPELEGEGEKTFGIRLFATSVTSRGVPFLWPLKLPGPDGRSVEWHRSALEGAERAQSVWTRIQSDQHLGAYRITVSD